MSKKEKVISDLMESLGISKEEATELAEYDNEEFELEEVQEMAEKAKGIIKADRKVQKTRKKGEGTDGVTTQKREKKINENKVRIIQTLEKALIEEGLNPIVKNNEKTILLEIGGKKYEIDLKEKREPKVK